MNSKITVWLVVLTLGLLGYIYFVDLHTPLAARRAAGPRALLSELDLAKVTGLEIAQSNQVIRAERVGEHWQLTTPKYPAQSLAITSFLNVLTNLHRESEIPAQDIVSKSGGLSPFGLDPPAATIRIQSGSHSLQLRVGSKTLLGDRVYVQPVGDGVFMTDASLLQHLPASVNQWRNPMLAQGAGLGFDRVAITVGARSLKLERDNTNQLWRLVEPMVTRADFSRVEYLIQQLRAARVTRFVTDDPTDDLDTYGQQTPEADLRLQSGSNTVFEVQFGKSPTNDPAQVYARPMTHTNVVLISRELADLVEKPYTEFRDRVLVSFRPSAVDRIEGKADEAFAVERQGTNGWDIVQPFRAPADRELMQQFVEGLSKLEIIGFEKDFPVDFGPYGLAKPIRQYVLKSAITTPVGPTNQTLAEVDFGTNPTNELDKVYCRRLDESSVYVVRSMDMLNLERTAYRLRDRQIWTFAPSNVVKITAVQRGQTNEWVRDVATHLWGHTDGMANAALEETVHRLSTLHADYWSGFGAADAKLYGIADSKYQITLDLNEAGKPRHLSVTFGKLAMSGQPYAAVVLEQNQPVIFKFPIKVYEFVAQYLRVPTAGGEP
jgi:hypothetical protein